MKTASDVVELLRSMAAALRVFGQTRDEHEASFALDRAARIVTRLIADELVPFPDQEWLVYLEEWRAINPKRMEPKR